MKFLYLLVSAFILSACSSSPPISAKDAKTKETFFSLVKEKSSKNSQIIIVRDSIYAGSLLDFNIFIDGRMIEVLRPGEKIEFGAKPSPYIIGLGCSPCKSGYRKEIQMNALEGKSHYFLVTMMNGFEIQPTTQIQ